MAAAALINLLAFFGDLTVFGRLPLKTGLEVGPG